MTKILSKPTRRAGRVVFSICLSPATNEKLNRLAKDQKRSKNFLVIQAIHKDLGIKDAV